MNKTIKLDSARELKDVVAKNEEVFNLLCLSSNVSMTANGEPAALSVELAGDDKAVLDALSFIQALRKLRSMGIQLANVAGPLLKWCLETKDFNEPERFSEAIIKVGPHRPPVMPKTLGQLDYLDCIDHHDVTLCAGAAGTGKSYLAVAKAINGLLANKYERIVLTRPALESGESLGYLPGSMEEKIEPYLRPLYDAIGDMLEPDDHDRLVRKGKIEIAPLAYMRGRTLADCFVILDEAQNITPKQMLMFLTRIGIGTKCVVCGDTSQVDLPSRTISGLHDAITRLKGIEGIGVHYMTEDDIVRHRLVREIIVAYSGI